MKCASYCKFTFIAVNVIFVIYAILLATKAFYVFCVREYKPKYTTPYIGIAFLSLFKLLYSSITIYKIIRNKPTLIIMHVVCLLLFIFANILLVIYRISTIHSNRNLLNDQNLHLEMVQSEKIQSWEYRYGCCGYNGAKDYEDLGKPISSHCCDGLRGRRCTMEIAKKKRGCRESLHTHTEYVEKPELYIIIFVLILEILALCIVVFPYIYVKFYGSSISVISSHAENYM